MLLAILDTRPDYDCNRRHAFLLPTPILHVWLVPGAKSLLCIGAEHLQLSESLQRHAPQTEKS